MQICKNCIQPDSRPGLYFTNDGICGACLWENEKKEINWNERFGELENIAKNIKKNNSSSNYDCVIGVSGGKDSTRQAIIARDELNLRCLLVNCEPPNITEIGKKVLKASKDTFDKSLELAGKALDNTDRLAGGAIALAAAGGAFARHRSQRTLL